MVPLVTHAHPVLIHEHLRCMFLFNCMGGHQKVRYQCGENWNKHKNACQSRDIGTMRAHASASAAACALCPKVVQSTWSFTAHVTYCGVSVPVGRGREKPRAMIKCAAFSGAGVDFFLLSALRRLRPPSLFRLQGVPDAPLLGRADRVMRGGGPRGGEVAAVDALAEMRDVGIGIDADLTAAGRRPQPAESVVFREVAARRHVLIAAQRLGARPSGSANTARTSSARSAAPRRRDRPGPQRIEEEQCRSADAPMDAKPHRSETHWLF